MQPNKVVGVGSGAHVVLEYATGTFQSGDIEIGDLLYIQPNFEHRTSFKVLRNLLHWPMNLCIAILWARFIFASLQQMLTDSGILTAGILVHNTLLFLLFLTRRPSRETSHNVFDWLVAFATLGFAMMSDTMRLRKKSGIVLFPVYFNLYLKIKPSIIFRIKGFFKPIASSGHTS